MKLRSWAWVYLVSGPRFALWAVLVYYGGAVVLLVAALFLTFAALLSVFGAR